MNTEFLKLRIICSRARSQDQFLYAKVQSILVLPPPLSASAPHFVFYSYGNELRQVLSNVNFAIVRSELKIRYND